MATTSPYERVVLTTSDVLIGFILKGLPSGAESDPLYDNISQVIPPVNINIQNTRYLAVIRELVENLLRDYTNYQFQQAFVNRYASQQPTQGNLENLWCSLYTALLGNFTSWDSILKVLLVISAIIANLEADDWTDRTRQLVQMVISNFERDGINIWIAFHGGWRALQRYTPSIVYPSPYPADTDFSSIPNLPEQPRSVNRRHMQGLEVWPMGPFYFEPQTGRGVPLHQQMTPPHHRQRRQGTRLRYREGQYGPPPSYRPLRVRARVLSEPYRRVGTGRAGTSSRTAAATSSYLAPPLGAKAGFGPAGTSQALSDVAAAASNEQTSADDSSTSSTSLLDTSSSLSSEDDLPFDFATPTWPDYDNL